MTLKEWRMKQGLTQSELASMTDARLPYISLYETGKMEPPEEFKAKINSLSEGAVDFNEPIPQIVAAEDVIKAVLSKNPSGFEMTASDILSEYPTKGEPLPAPYALGRWITCREGKKVLGECGYEVSRGTKTENTLYIITQKKRDDKDVALDVLNVITAPNETVVMTAKEILSHYYDATHLYPLGTLAFQNIMEKIDFREYAKERNIEISDARPEDGTLRFAVTNTELVLTDDEPMEVDEPIEIPEEQEEDMQARVEEPTKKVPEHFMDIIRAKEPKPLDGTEQEIIEALRRNPILKASITLLIQVVENE